MQVWAVVRSSQALTFHQNKRSKCGHVQAPKRDGKVYSKGEKVKTHTYTGMAYLTW